ncbi:MAG: HAD-IB family hydrolase [Patescibacteria group bacterium]
MQTRRPKPLAIFDIDGTIFRSSLLIELTKHLVKSKIFPYVAYKELEAEKLNWQNRKGSYEEYINKVVKVFEKQIRGVSVRKLTKATNQVLQKHKDRVYVYTRDLITRLQRTHTLIAISGSPDMAVQEFKRIWGFNYAYGTQYEHTNGKYTGHVVLVASKNKRSLLQHFCIEHSVTLTRSVGVGDTESDVSFLGMVSHPIAFNPNAKLLKVAKKKRWLIVVERKDVVYTI